MVRIAQNEVGANFNLSPLSPETAIRAILGGCLSPLSYVTKKDSGKNLPYMGCINTFASAMRKSLLLCETPLEHV